jgi:hypothetical protein
MKAGAEILYGDLELDKYYAPYSKIQLVKSLIMCLFLSLGSLFLLPINDEYMKYVLEAYKWALRSTCFFLFHISYPLDRIVACFQYSPRFDRYLSYFLFLRQNPRLDLLFSLQVPWQIIKLHLFSLKYH